VRFDGVERALHWVNAAMFSVLVLTAIPLYFGSLAAVVGHRDVVARIHVWTGVFLPVPVLLSVLGPWGRTLRADLRRVNRWSAGELAWLRSFGRDAFVRLDKLNPGQKLNVSFTGGSIVVMLMTGAVMWWFGPFPDSWRTGATFVHDVLATFIVVVIVGHVGMALTHPASLRSMITGRVSRRWARRHAPAWADEMAAES